MWQNPQFTKPEEIGVGSRLRVPGGSTGTDSKTNVAPPSMKTAMPVAPGLSKPQQAMLNMIARRESGGDYSIINYKAQNLIDTGRLKTSGGPGEHPFANGYLVDGKPVPGKEKYTAAGRYQMVWTTWKDAAALAGVDPKDFSPANQDRAALALAQQSYKNKFGGDLNSALADPSKTSQVIAGLTPWSVQAGGPGFTPKDYAAAAASVGIAQA